MLLTRALAEREGRKYFPLFDHSSIYNVQCITC